MNTFAQPNTQAVPSAPLLQQPGLTNPNNPMQALAALMTPQQSYGSGTSLPIGSLLQMLQNQNQNQPTTAAAIPGQGQGAGPGTGTGGLY